MKTVFINPELDRFRSGWRMLFFFLVFSACTSILQVVYKGMGSVGVGSFLYIVRESSLYIVLLAVTIGWVKWYEHRPVASVGLKINKRFGFETAQGLLVGGGMMTFIFIIEYASGLITISMKPLSAGDAVDITLMAMLVFTVGAFGEELLFRGYLFQVLIEGTNKIIAIAIFGLFFGLAHLANPHVTFFSFVNIVLAGVWLSVAFLKTRSLALPFGMHFAWNFLQSNVFSFPVSGIDFSNLQLGVLTQSGPEWLTGGSFGPEGGALATLMVLSGTALIYYSPWFSASAGVWKYEQWIAERKTTVTQGQTEEHSPVEQ